MREYKRWFLLSAVVVLALMAGALAPAPISADETSNDKMVALSSTAPDLVIKTITWSPQVPIIGDTVTFTVTIENQGSEQADYSRVAYYIDDTYQTSAYVNPVDPGAETTTTFTWDAQAGPHAIKAVADYNNRVIESDETNNANMFAFSVLAPDLIAETITWSPESPSIGDKVTFTVTIKNQGNSRARCSNVDLYIDGNPRGYRSVPRIDAGATVTMTFTWPAKAGSHTVEAVADVLNQVSESDEANNAKTVTYSTSAPDLIINSITWSPADPSPNTTVTFTVVVKNQGSGKADYSHLDCYIDDDLLATFYISQMNSGATVTKTFTWTSSADAHTVKAVIDSHSRVIESDETNNTKEVALPSVAPDLIIQDITWSPTNPLLAHRITFTVTIKNQGKTGAVFSRVYLYIDDEFKNQTEVPAVAAGATATMTFSWTPLSDSHVLKAVADANNCVQEGNESNNVKTVTVTFSSSPASSPDLTVQNIAWSPANPSIEEPVIFTVSIKNQGSILANPSHVAYYVDDTCLTSAYVNQISPGATATTTFTWPAQAGSHTIKAVVDSNEIIAESNETNNEKAVALSITAPDLVIQNITWSPLNPSIGDRVSFTVTIKNQGGIMASPSCVAYYLDGSYRGFHNIPEIDAGATATATFTWTTQAGSHTIKIVTDMESQVTESHESNNEKTVNLPAPDLAIETISWSPSNPSKSDNVTFSITVRNRGMGGAGSSDVHFYIDDSSNGYETIPEIDAGATATTTFTWNWTGQADSHSIKAVADGENQIVESDESNNEKSVIFSVSLPPETTPQPTPAPPTSPNQQEASANLSGESSEASPAQDIVSNPPEEPQPAHSSAKGIWLSWWFISAIVLVGGTAIIVMLRFRQRPH